MLGRYRTRCSRWRSDEDGATAVEFALISPLLIFMMMGVVELGLYLSAESVLEHASYTATRLGRTGYTDKDNKLTREQTIRAALEGDASVLIDPAKVKISSRSFTDFDEMTAGPEPFIDANGNGVRDDGENYTDLNGNGKYDDNSGTAGYGGKNTVVVYTITYPWKFITPMIGSILGGSDNTLDITVHAVVKNEPF
ncbi:pilus assembly protein [Afifella sp. JA880]|uniref:TadE/TadG family type IV pilus assembly protein n=1 Tax=Afifella sp. JA880 TaxID=2975280 RepID=UPI0021BB1BE4|nr:TadE/TadG family type IV pilus assembly protein [Afifella sp. JA880]MCT8268503.1 pilus assembly protein [Afifella sp. JA880]